MDEEEISKRSQLHGRDSSSVLMLF